LQLASLKKCRSTTIKIGLNTHYEKVETNRKNTQNRSRYKLKLIIMIRNLKNGLIALALCSVTFSFAQKGNGNPNDGGVIQPDPCEFATNVQLIGESSPEVGTVQTYTLQNADATERKI